MSGISKAYGILQKLPRVSLGNLKPLYPSKTVSCYSSLFLKYSK